MLLRWVPLAVAGNLLFGLEYRALHRICLVLVALTRKCFSSLHWYVAPNLTPYTYPTPYMMSRLSPQSYHSLLATW